MEISLKENGGLIRLTFEDRVGNHCIMQVYESTVDNTELIRLGVILDFDDNVSSAMSLTREQLMLLMPFLDFFCKNKKLPFNDNKE